MSEDKSLVLLTEADRALALATSIPEVRELRDQFTAAKAWARSRGLGVESENKATEYILRAERKIGAELIRMLEAGERVSRADGRQSMSPQTGDIKPETYQSLGIDWRDGGKWQRVALISDDEFEERIRKSKDGRERIAKFNFYRTLYKRRIDGSPETPPDEGFDMFRAGAYHLLGWRVDESGVGAPTKNGLLMLPLDELASFVEIIKYLVAAYNEAKLKREAPREHRS